eukprot:PhM_4_TR4546/c0_g1_i1/m.1166/K14859/SSF1_2; ribosome biogenesis protein SSF1/2
MPYKGTRRKKKRTHQDPEKLALDAGKSIEAPPRSAIYHHGASDPTMAALIQDWRRVFLPHTMNKLKAKNANTVRDFVALSGPLGLTHMHIFSSPNFGATLRLGRLPRGPTLLFRVESYTTSRDIVSKQRRSFVGGQLQFNTPPLVILNGFKAQNDRPDLKLMSDMLQSLVPPVAVDSSLELNKIQRVLLFQHVADSDGLVEVRHYTIVARPVGLSRAIQKLRDGNVPRTMSSAESISDVVTQEGLLSDTDGEGEEVNLPEEVNFKRQAGRCRVKLIELGPRMTWQLMRVEAGLCGGEVLWHRYVNKTEDEIIRLRAKAKTKERTKRQRAKEQQANVEAKKQKKTKVRAGQTPGEFKDEAGGDDGVGADFEEVGRDDAQFDDLDFDDGEE